MKVGVDRQRALTTEMPKTAHKKTGLTEMPTPQHGGEKALDRPTEGCEPLLINHNLQ